MFYSLTRDYEMTSTERNNKLHWEFKMTYALQSVFITLLLLIYPDHKQSIATEPILTGKKSNSDLFVVGHRALFAAAIIEVAEEEVRRSSTESEKFTEQAGHENLNRHRSFIQETAAFV